MGTPLTSKAALLQALRDGPGYGLDLIERVRRLSNGKFDLSTGSVYPALRELEQEGLVHNYSAGPKIPERGGRQRIFYNLTDEGRRLAEEYEMVVSMVYGLRPAGEGG